MARVLSGEFARLCEGQAGVLTVSSAARYLGRSAVRWRLTSGRWRLVGSRMLVTQSGPLTEEQRLWVAVLAAGAGAVLGGLTAARLDGLAGFDDHRIYLLIPSSRQWRTVLPGAVVHRSRRLGAEDVHPGADMRRDNELTIDGYRVLRFPAFVVRDNPRAVAVQIARALRQAGALPAVPGRGQARPAGR